MQYKFTGLVLLFATLLASCGTDDLTPQAHEISFSLSSNSNSAERSIQSQLEDAESIIVTIQTMDGAATDYTLEEIDLYNLNGEFISEKISLTSGQYKLTEFLVLDGENNISHLAPIAGSQQAQNVSNPLAIAFGVGATDTTSISVEVISSEHLNLEDFGYVGFSLSEIDLFDFLISVNEKGNSADFLEAQLTISNEDYQFTQDLQAIINNHVAIKNGYDSYNLRIEKEGYRTFGYSFTKDSLEFYSSSPLNIELTFIDSANEFLAISALVGDLGNVGTDLAVGQSFTVGEKGGYLSKIQTYALGGIPGDELITGIANAKIIIRKYINDEETEENHGLTGDVLSVSIGDGRIINFDYHLNDTDDYRDVFPTSEFEFSDSLYLAPNTRYVIEFVYPGLACYQVIPGQYEGGKGYSIEGIYNEYERDFPFALYLKE
jgi:hypothetical protein